MNGIVERITDDGFLVAVKQSFGNCPKYIQARQVEYLNIDSIGTVHSATALNELTRQIVLRADTLFIATAHPGPLHGTTRSHGADVSHRGGKPGFVRVDRGNTLTLPDFAGNRFFNTLRQHRAESARGLALHRFRKRRRCSTSRLMPKLFSIALSWMLLRVRNACCD